MSVTTELSCFLASAKPSDVLVCFANVNGTSGWNIIFIALTVIMVIGWSIGTSRFSHGMAIGGFIASLSGLGLVALELISMKIWFFAVIVTLAGVIIAVIKNNSDD